MNKKIWYSPHKFDTYNNDEIQAVINSLNNGWLAGNGECTIQFEKEIAEKFNKKYALFVNSGSSANLLAIASLKLPRNNKVITPACTFSTVVAPIIQLNLKPVFCDVNLNNFIPTLDTIINLIDDDTKIIMIPNLIGFIFDWEGLKNHLIKINRTDIITIEDSCDTITDTSYSDIACTSFYSTHIITAGGTGGMVMFNNIELYKTAKAMRDWGRKEIHNDTDFFECDKLSNRLSNNVDNIIYDSKYLFTELPYHMKCCEMCAAFGLSQLTKLDSFIDKRRQNMNRLFNNLKNNNNVQLPNINNNLILLAFPLLVNKDRNKLMQYLEDNNIQSRAIFSGNITRHDMCREYYQEFRNADIIMKNGILVGIHQGLTFDDIDIICNTIKNFYK